MSDDKSLDILGIKGLSEAIRVSVERFWDGAAAFLSRVCLPAAEEFGLALRDRVSAWRARNAAKILDGANKLQLAQGLEAGEALHPRLAHIAIDEGSWSDDDEVQRMWSGLLVSGTSREGRSEENLLFMNLLRQLSPLQIRILRYSAETAVKLRKRHDLVLAEQLTIPTEEIVNLFGESDIHRLDRELDHLRGLGLIGDTLGGGGIHPDAGLTVLTPSSLGLSLYVRGQGSKVPPARYWNLPEGATVGGAG